MIINFIFLIYVVSDLIHWEHNFNVIMLHVHPKYLPVFFGNLDQNPWQREMEISTVTQYNEAPSFPQDNAMSINIIIVNVYYCAWVT